MSMLICLNEPRESGNSKRAFSRPNFGNYMASGVVLWIPTRGIDAYRFGKISSEDNEGSIQNGRWLTLFSFWRNLILFLYSFNILKINFIEDLLFYINNFQISLLDISFSGFAFWESLLLTCVNECSIFIESI